MNVYRPLEIMCHNPWCGNVITARPGSGRPRKYCDDACRRSAYRKNPQPTTEALQHMGYIQELAQDLCLRLAATRDLIARNDTTAQARQDQTFHLLRNVDLLTEDIEMLRAATVQQARDRDIKLAQVGQLWNLTPAQIRRAWPAHSIGRRMRRRAGRRRTELLTTGCGPSVPPPRLRVAGDDTSPRRGCDPDSSRGNGPLHTFACAMSYLQRTSGTSYKDLAAAARVHRSFVYRVLAGER